MNRATLFFGFASVIYIGTMHCMEMENDKRSSDTQIELGIPHQQQEIDRTTCTQLKVKVAQYGAIKKLCLVAAAFGLLNAAKDCATIFIWGRDPIFDITPEQQTALWNASYVHTAVNCKASCKPAPSCFYLNPYVECFQYCDGLICPAPHTQTIDAKGYSINPLGTLNMSSLLFNGFAAVGALFGAGAAGYQEYKANKALKLLLEQLTKEKEHE